MWFAYISVVTVGFGDIHLPHDTIKAWDMLYLPLIFLIGFVLVRGYLYISTFCSSHCDGVSDACSLVQLVFHYNPTLRSALHQGQRNQRTSWFG